MKFLKSSAVLVATIVLTGHPFAQPQVNPTAASIDDFNKRVKAYADLRTKESNGLAQLKPNSSPAEILTAEKALAAKIKIARGDAQQGDIFTPAVVPVFKTAFDDYYK